MSVVRSHSDRVSEPAEPVAPPISARRLLLILGGAFERPAGGVHGLGARQPRFRARRDLNERCGRETPQAAAKYAPNGVAVAQGNDRGELLVSWRMPIRPEVVATVIYEGDGAKARAIVTATPAPGLPTGDAIRTAERSASLPVRGTPCSLDDRVTNAVSRAVCAVPR